MTQNERLLKYLKVHRSIDPMAAWSSLGIYRLGARVWDLKRMGYNIITTTKKVKNQFGEDCRVAKYVLMV